MGMTTSKLETINKDLETIIKSQLEYEATLKEGLEAEKRVSGTLLKKWLDREQTITDWEYSYWVLQRKFEKALKDIRFLNHYIETNELRKKKKVKEDK
jgi:hypothetical protein